MFRSKKHVVRSKQQGNESTNSAYNNKSSKQNNSMSMEQPKSKQTIYKNQHSQSSNITAHNESIDDQEDQSDIE